MKLTSSAFVDGGNIPSKYTCDDKNISPPLEISDVPKNANKKLIKINQGFDTIESIFCETEIILLPIQLIIFC